MGNKADIDKIDKKILNVLQENGRITNLNLSNLAGLSPAPTLERVRKLEKSGVIKSYHANVDAEKLGLNLQVVIMVSLTRQINNAMQRFCDKIQTIEEIVECVQVTGGYDYLLRVVVKDVQGLDKLINSKLSKIDEIGSMRTNVILSTIKKANKVPL
ncbi:MAG TPA: AsnC family transcriptional regulator [Flavobacteriales bacterium]|jgi:Lrp/AsnC family leucine-responsive transcriptional regulator|nr:AsnC family transcriptional regulator [Flavobacteriales bacterium]